ncbi:jg20048 [Pararge aegeria aegeria]|nr:jg20048 [Pararge aegeria aegeria]
MEADDTPTHVMLECTGVADQRKTWEPPPTPSHNSGSPRQPGRPARRLDRVGMAGVASSAGKSYNKRIAYVR